MTTDAPTTVQYQGGEVFANLEERTITGLLLPFNEIGQTNAGKFMVEAGVIGVPADPMVVSANLDHQRSEVWGRANRLWQTEAGIMAQFTAARTPLGDEALADATSPEGKRKCLSAEFYVTVDAATGKATSGNLWGAGLVPKGAFPSAMVLAADHPDAPAVVAPAEAPAVDTDHPVLTMEEPPADITVVTPEATTVYTPDATPAEGQPEENTVSATEVMAGAVPASVPGAPEVNTTPATTVERVPSRAEIFAAFAAVKTNPSDGEAVAVLAALTDIKFSGTNTLGAGGAIQKNWLGLVNDGSVAQDREFITLGNLGTDITAGGKAGFKIRRGTAASPINPGDIPTKGDETVDAAGAAYDVGGEWLGNKTEINSYGAHTTLLASSLRKFAVGNDIAREFYDLPGGAEVIDAFISQLEEDYNLWSDEVARRTLVALAAANTIAPATAAYNPDYPDALNALIQGVLAVKRRKADGRKDVPTFAIANEAAFSELMYMVGGEENMPAWVNIAVSTDGGATVDGSVKVVEGELPIEDTAAVAVGAKRGVDFDELAGGPLIVNAVDLAKGGVDRAVHGYVQTFVRRPEAFVLIGTADTP